jgi:hypothetical protein
MSETNEGRKKGLDKRISGMTLLKLTLLVLKKMDIYFFIFRR